MLLWNIESAMELSTENKVVCHDIDVNKLEIADVVVEKPNIS
jgi:hypothetical protein